MKTQELNQREMEETFGGQSSMPAMGQIQWMYPDWVPGSQSSASSATGTPQMGHDPSNAATISDGQGSSSDQGTHYTK